MIQPLYIRILLLRSLFFTALVFGFAWPCLAQDSARHVLTIYLENTGGRALWAETEGLHTAGVYFESNGGFHNTEVSGLPVEFVFVQYSDGRSIMTSRPIEQHAVESRQCIAAGELSMLQLQAGDTLAHYTRPYETEEAKRVYGRFCPQRYLLDSAALPEIHYEGIERAGDTRYWVLSIAEGKKITHWSIDIETGFLRMMGDLSTGDYVLLSEYREVNGRMLPFKEETFRKRQLIHAKIIQEASFIPGDLSCDTVFFR